MTNTSAGVHARAETRPDGAKVGWVTLENPGKINIVNSALCQELCDAIGTLSNDDDIRALVLTGAGDRAFIGGADIAEMVSLNTESARAFITELHEVCAAVRAAPVPVIARIQGYCLGGGLEVAAACDMRVASDDAVFGMPEVRVGIPSVIEAALLPTLVGWGKTRELLFTGANLNAAEALACGLIEKVVTADELDGAVALWLDGITASGPLAIRAQKALIRQWESLSLADAIAAGVDVFSASYETDEPRSRMQAFIDRKRR